MKSRDLVLVSDLVLRLIFASLGLEVSGHISKATGLGHSVGTLNITKKWLIGKFFVAGKKQPKQVKKMPEI